MQSSFAGLEAWYSAASTVVASTPFLASFLNLEFSQQQLAAGRQAWSRPRILPVDAWLASSWGEARFAGTDLPALLSPAQELALWRSAIDELTPDLFDPGITARSARRAAQLMAEWHIPSEEEAWKDHADGMEFLRWRAAVAGRCRAKGWITRSQLWHQNPDWCDGKAAAFAGFDRVSPGLAMLRQRLAKSVVFGVRHEERPGPAAAKPYADSSEEWDGAARWARAALERDDSGSFAVLVPGLPSHRASVERAFASVFYPGADVPDAAAFHIAAAAPLLDQPLIADALLLVQLGAHRLEQVSATAILRSPFIAGAQWERNERALADLKLRKTRELDVSWREITYAAQACPELIRRFTQIRRLRDEMRPVQPLGEWSRFFAALVESLGWPGDAELTPHELLLVEAWRDSLSQLSALALVMPPLGFEGAVAQLKSVLGRARSPEHGDLLAPVQILDAADAPGLRCDAALVTGMSDETWPPAPAWSSLIPMRLQKQVGWFDAEEREHATRALFAVAETTEVSYVGRLAPAAAEYVTEQRTAAPRWSGRTAIQSFAPASLDVVNDSHAPPFLISGNARGGTTLIKNQSLCPFKAFAEGRLRAQAPEEACFGFDARDRGGFIHAVLERVWAKLKTSADLKHASDEQLRLLIATAVMETVRQGGDGTFFEQIREAERQRIEGLVFDWLIGVERKRKMSFVVEETERELHFDLAGLPLRIRIDRIDRLVDGRLILIDYKSGPKTHGALRCPRPKEPQLLVYAAAKGSRVVGVFFGVLTRGELRLAGWSDGSETARTIKKHEGTWEVTMADAQQTVEGLARDFLRGEASVHPTAEACQYCGLGPLCRISEQKQNREDCDDTE